MTAPNAFYPVDSITVSATTTSGATVTAMPGIAASIDTARVVNTGSATAYLVFATTANPTPTATVNSMAILAGVIEVFDIPQSTIGFAVYSAGTTTVNVTGGSNA